MAQDKIIIEVDPGESFDEVIEKKKTVRVQSFSLGGGHYCLEMGQAREVIPLPEVTRVPNVPPFIEGVINYRGEIIALIDLNYFFGLTPKRKATRARVIVTDAAGYAVGIMIDELQGTLDIELDRIQPPLSTLEARTAAFTKGQVQMKDGILILLDMEKVLNCHEIKSLREGEK